MNTKGKATPLPPESRVQWVRAHRIIPTRYPPIQLFERIGEPSEWETLAELESMTNSRVRQEIGEISLVPAQDRVSGPGASLVMASFTHLGRPSRFSDGSYGVYYAARAEQTSVLETSYHLGKFLAATREGACDVDMIVLAGKLNTQLHDVRHPVDQWQTLHKPDSYVESQALARALREQGSHGLVYRSVRHPGGECVCIFKPKAIKIPKRCGVLQYHWDGTRIDRCFDYRSDTWVDVNAHT